MSSSGRSVRRPRSKVGRRVQETVMVQGRLRGKEPPSHPWWDRQTRGATVAILTVTSEVGGTTRPVGALYVPPGRDVLDAGAGTTFADAGLDAAFTADLLSACLSHER